MVWQGNPHRATRDLDLLGHGSPDPDSVRAVLSEVFETDVEDDGVAFDVDSLAVGPIRDNQEYGGIRATSVARLGSARIRVQIDVGFGDAITPTAEPTDVPTMLDLPAPRLRVYPRETVVAEKVEAMCQLGLANSRMKDFYDLAVLARTFEFDGRILIKAVRTTFSRRGTPLPEVEPVALTAIFHDDAAKRRQWRAFLKKAQGTDLGDLPAVIAEVRAFVLPLITPGAADLGHRTWVDGEWRTQEGSEAAGRKT